MKKTKVLPRLELRFEESESSEEKRERQVRGVWPDAVRTAGA